MRTGMLADPACSLSPALTPQLLSAAAGACARSGPSFRSGSRFILEACNSTGAWVPRASPDWRRAGSHHSCCGSPRGPSWASEMRALDSLPLLPALPPFNTLLFRSQRRGHLLKDIVSDSPGQPLLSVLYGTHWHRKSRENSSHLYLLV